MGHRQRRRGAVAGLVLVITATATPPAFAAPPEEAGSPGSLMVVLDSSGSMAAPDADGRPRIDAARTALDDLISGLPAHQQVGMRVFGATVAESSDPGACTDSQLVVPIGTDNRAALGTAVGDYQPKGDTPIGFALQEAGKDLAATDGNRTILLVSDGQSTCRPDPCDVAAELSGDGIDLQIHAVGLSVDEATRTQLRCIAEKGHGTYVDADNTDDLTDALEQVSLRAAQQFSVRGRPVTGTADEAGAPEITAGQWTDVFGPNGSTRYYSVRRQTPGSSIHVGVSTRARHGYSSIDLELTGPGIVPWCDWELSMPSEITGGANVMGSLAVVAGSPLDEGADPCRDAQVLTFRIETTEGSALAGVPFEIVVQEEPPIISAAGLPEYGDPTWQPMDTTQEPIPLVGGASFNDAPLLEPGRTYSADLATGESVFYRVPVQWGQSLQAQARLAASTGDRSGDIGDIGSASLRLFGPDRHGVHGIYLMAEPSGVEHTFEDWIWAGRQTDLQAVSKRVAWQNRGSNCERPAMAGDHYVVLTAGHRYEPRLQPYTLTVGTFGEVDAAPPYTTVAGPAQARPTEQVEEPTARKRPPGPVVGGLVGTTTLALVAGGVVVATVRRRRMRS